MTGSGTACTNGKHQHHMCSLKAAGANAEIERLPSSPAVECGICGAKANAVENVCTPVKVWEKGELS
jgi:hypothetical protein